MRTLTGACAVSIVTGEPRPEITFRTWDESAGDGKLFVYLESLGPLGIVRADSWEEAWECVVDEIMDDADPEDPDSYATSYDPDAEPGELAEGVHWRGSGQPSNPALTSHLAREDLNGSYLRETSEEGLRERYRIALVWEG